MTPVEMPYDTSRLHPRAAVEIQRAAVLFFYTIFYSVMRDEA